MREFGRDLWSCIRDAARLRKAGPARRPTGIDGWPPHFRLRKAHR